MCYFTSLGSSWGDQALSELDGVFVVANEQRSARLTVVVDVGTIVWLAWTDSRK